MKRLMADPGQVDAILIEGGNRAREIAAKTMTDVKNIVGFIHNGAGRPR
jgi:tryptophanyl-tRNA synthetase